VALGELRGVCGRGVVRVHGEVESGSTHDQNTR
jgi:hypothetical protein